MSLTSGGGAVDWLHWSGDAFRRARAERKPVLLSIVASWAGGCREMDRVCYADPAVAAQIHGSLIPIRVDADERPDIADRYDLGGLPTTAFLNEDGELLGGGTFVPPERLRAAIDTVLRQGAGLESEGGARTPSPACSSRPDGTVMDDDALVEVVFSSFDEAHAGFGGAPKFPLAAPVRLAIDLYAEGHDPQMLERAVRTLDAMGWGALYDAQAGGFFRCAAGDWTAPEPEKLLATNVSLLELYIHAGERLGHERWFMRAADMVDYVNRALTGSNRGWRVSECADPGREFTDGNALAVSAMLRAAAALSDDAPGQRALDALEQVLLASYKPGHGVAHSASGVRGLLLDHVAMGAACLDAWEATGNIVYRMMAQELMYYPLRTMWDDAGGGFFDRSDEVRPDEPSTARLKPFVLNCDAAALLDRIAQAAGDRGLAERARDTLDAMRARAAESGPLAAHYLIARRAVPR